MSASTPADEKFFLSANLSVGLLCHSDCKHLALLGYFQVFVLDTFLVGFDTKIEVFNKC
jgi:hypothetical protein